MATKKSKMIWWIVGIIVVIGGVVGFVLWQRRKKEKEAEEKNKKVATGTPTGTITNDKLAKMLGVSQQVMNTIASFVTIGKNDAGDWIIKSTSPILSFEKTIKKAKVDEILAEKTS